jgi:hypothetical protein
MHKNTEIPDQARSREIHRHKHRKILYGIWMNKINRRAANYLHWLSCAACWAAGRLLARDGNGSGSGRVEKIPAHDYTRGEY